MASDILTTLEFDRVRDQLVRHCQFTLAAERAAELEPTSDLSDVRYLQSVTAEAYALIEPALPVGEPLAWIRMDCHRPRSKGARV